MAHTKKIAQNQPTGFKTRTTVSTGSIQGLLLVVIGKDVSSKLWLTNMGMSLVSKHSIVEY